MERDSNKSTPVHQLRKRGWTVEEIAGETGASVRTVYRWLAGHGVLPIFNTLMVQALGGSSIAA